MTRPRLAAFLSLCFFFSSFFLLMLSSRFLALDSLSFSTFCSRCFHCSFDFFFTTFLRFRLLCNKLTLSFTWKIFIFNRLFPIHYFNSVDSLVVNLPSSLRFCQMLFAMRWFSSFRQPFPLRPSPPVH